MVLDHSRLHRVEPALGQGEIVDGDDLHAIDLSQQMDAAVDGPIAQLTIDQRSNGDGAGATVAFGTPLLGPAGALLEPQVVKNGGGGRDIIEFDDLATAQETDGGAHH